jgi:glycine N-methyltransferase
MLKYALQERWNRRQEKNFDNWSEFSSFYSAALDVYEFFLCLVIQEANWLTLFDDIKDLVQGGFDAVICLGNSFAHMTDSYSDQREQKQAIRNFEKCVKPGGLLLIDHRNYDNIMETGSTPSKCIYYNVSIIASHD